MKGTFNVAVIVLGYFIFNGLGKVWPPELSYYWLVVVILVVCEGIVLAFVQKDLNAYWKLERDKVDL